MSVSALPPFNSDISFPSSGLWQDLPQTSRLNTRRLCNAYARAVVVAAPRLTRNGKSVPGNSPKAKYGNLYPWVTQVAAISTTLAPCASGLTGLLVKAIYSKFKTGKPATTTHVHASALQCNHGISSVPVPITDQDGRPAGHRNYDLMTFGNSVLAGLVAITSACSTVLPWGAVVIGIVAGVVYNIGSQVETGASIRLLFSRAY